MILLKFFKTWPFPGRYLFKKYFGILDFEMK